MSITSSVVHNYTCIANKHQMPGCVLLASGNLLLDPKNFSSLPLTSLSIQELHLLLMELAELVSTTLIYQHCDWEFEHIMNVMEPLMMTQWPNQCLFFIPFSLSKSPEVRSRTQANFASASVSLSSGQTSCSEGQRAVKSNFQNTKKQKKC